MNNIDKKLKEAKRNGKKLFVPFISAGHPDLKTTEELLYMFDAAGADVVELGVPFSDPLADGPVIQHASQVALKNGTTVKKILDLVKKVRAQVDCGIILFGALNPFLNYGLPKFMREAKKCGVDGVLIPDCPPEEYKEVREQAKKYGISTILLVAPTTPSKRITAISRLSDPFVYCISVKGVTGVRQGVSRQIGRFLSRVKKNVTKPFVVGFGISTPADVKRIARYADGVVVGSAFVKKLDAIGDRKKRLAAVERYTRQLVKACKE